jgi:hypothetical protein
MSTQIGITFSQPHLESLGLAVEPALTKALEYHFAHLRLGAYWNRIEVKPGKYDFTELKNLLAGCEKAGQAVVLTLGVKAPRWPEYYWPDFVAVKNPHHLETQHHLLKFLKETVLALKHFSCITHWQVENEPFDPSGPDHLTMPETFLAAEINLVRTLDARPIITTLWGNDLLGRGFFSKAETLSDVVGLDIYYKQFVYKLLNHSFYQGPRHSAASLATYLKQRTKPIWLTELQAEPWEKDTQAYQATHPASMSPRLLQENLHQVQLLPVTEILLWGFEYWLWRAQQGDHSYLDLMKNWQKSCS